PDYAKRLLEHLQTLFYHSSIHTGGNDESMKEAMTLSYMMVKGNVLLDRKWFFVYFSDMLRSALYEVWQSPIEVTTTEWQETLISQQTYADRKNQIANELVQFPIGQAMVKSPEGEYRMRTIMPQTTK